MLQKYTFIHSPLHRCHLCDLTYLYCPLRELRRLIRKRRDRLKWMVSLVGSFFAPTYLATVMHLHAAKGFRGFLGTFLYVAYTQNLIIPCTFHQSGFRYASKVASRKIQNMAACEEYHVQCSDLTSHSSAFDKGAY